MFFNLDVVEVVLDQLTIPSFYVSCIFSCRQSRGSSKKDFSGFFPVASIASSVSSFFVCPISNLLLLDSLWFVSIVHVVPYAVSYAVAKYDR